MATYKKPLYDKDGNQIYPISKIEPSDMDSVYGREIRMLIPDGTEIPANTDLNTADYLRVGKYYCKNNANASTLTNSPTSRAFMLEVFCVLSPVIDDEATNDWCYRLRIITTYEGDRYVQTCNTSGTVGVWTYNSWLLDTPRDGTLTIQLDGTNVNTFTANSSSNKTANIVPRKLNNRFTSRPSSANLTQNGDGALTFFNATSSMTTGKPPSDGHIIQMDWDNDGGYDSQIALTNGNKPRLLARGQSGGTWGDWTEFTPVKRSSQGGVWSTFFWSGTRHTDGQETVYTRRGTELKINFGNGGTWCNICAGASGIRAVRQMWSGVFTAMNAQYGAGGLAASSTIYTRYYGALVNGGSAGIGEVARGVEGNSSSWGRYYGDLAGTTGGNRTSADCSMTSYRIGSSNSWVMSGTIGSQSVGTGMNFECRCVAYDAQTVPTTYQRGAGTNVSSYWQMIEVLES